MTKDILDTIGNTPMLHLSNIIGKDDAQIFLKYEKVNPGGSIKDRAANYIIQEAERRNLLKPGGTIIESSSGNFGISLAMIGAVKGYKVIILVDPKTTENNLALLKAYGAEVIVVTDKDDCGSYHKTRILLANQMAEKIKNSFRPDQCFSLLNSEAHYKHTAIEIMNNCNGNLDMIIAPVSTGGQLGGIARYMKEHNPKIKIVGVDAVGSAAFGGESHSYKIPGIGLGWTPENLQLKNIDYTFKVSDKDAYLASRIMAINEGIMIGPSSGACFFVALKFSQIMGKEKKIISMVSDSGERYIQTLFNNKWMKEQGFPYYVNVNELKEIAQKLTPWSENPVEYSNYNSELKTSLEIPNSTIQINSELKKESDSES